MKEKKERHYYRETNGTVSEITQRETILAIDTHMEENQGEPPEEIAREIGYSQIIVAKDDKPCFNPSMLQLASSGTRNSSYYILSRLKDAPKLPISCIAAAEHVIASQNQVKNFVCETEPKSKQYVMYRLVVRSLGGRQYHREIPELLYQAILNSDAKINQHDVLISEFTENRHRYFRIEIGTQIGDIQKIIKNIKACKLVRLSDAKFDEIGLNEGLCLVKQDTSNPIHALVNIAEFPHSQKKCLLERDAGLTTGLTTHSYQDSKWTFNMYENLEELKNRTGYKPDSYAVKLTLK